MGDATLESLNRMIDTAGRDDLMVVAAEEFGVLANVLTMLQSEVESAREGQSSESAEQALRRVHERACALAGKPPVPPKVSELTAPNLTVWGRVRLGGNGPWRPAYYSPQGAYVCPAPAEAWRWMRFEEDQTFQSRKNQRMIGRGVTEDALFYSEDGAA